MGASGGGGLDIDPRLGGHTPAAARSFDEYHAQQQQLALQRAMERDAQAIRDGSYLPFDPASPLANYDSMRAAAAAAHPDALMSTLSPRAHSRPRPHPPVRPPRLYHPTTNAPRSRSRGGLRSALFASASASAFAPVSIPLRGHRPLGNLRVYGTVSARTALPAVQPLRGAGAARLMLVRGWFGRISLGHAWRAGHRERYTAPQWLCHSSSSSHCAAPVWV